MVHELTRLLPLLSVVLLAAAVVLLRRYPVIGWLTIAGLVISVSDWTSPAAVANLGGVAIYPADAIAIVFLLAVLTTPGAVRHLEAADVAIWGVVLVMLLISLVRGFSDFGLAAAGNEARGIFGLAATTLWVWVRIPLPAFPRELYRWSWITALGLCVVAFVHISKRGLGAVDQQVLVNGDLVTTRPLVSTQALILGLIGLALVLRSREPVLRLFAVGFVALAVLCQHRSVWAALAVCIASLIVFAPSKQRTRLFGFGVLAGFVLLVLYDVGTLDPVITKFDAAYHNRGTLIDRELAWHTLVSQQNQMGITTVLTGQPFGTGYVRREPGGGIEAFAPHNYYVSLYLRIGLLGAAALFVALVRGLVRNFRFSQTIGVAWGAGLMTYCYAYNLQYYVAPILAVALGAHMAVAAKADDGVEAVPELAAVR